MEIILMIFYIVLGSLAFAFWKLGFTRTIASILASVPIGGLLGFALMYLYCWNTRESLCGVVGFFTVPAGIVISFWIISLLMSVIFPQPREDKNVQKAKNGRISERPNNVVLIIAVLFLAWSMFAILAYRYFDISILSSFLLNPTVISPILIIKLSFVRVPQRHRVIGVLSVLPFVAMLLFGYGYSPLPYFIYNALVISLAAAGVWGWYTKRAGFRSFSFAREKAKNGALH